MRSLYFILSILIVGTACQSTKSIENEAIELPNTLRIGVYEENLNLPDSIQSISETEELLHSLVYESLIDSISSTGNIYSKIFDLVNSDQYSLEIKVKNNVLHNGQKVTSRSIKKIFKNLWINKLQEEKVSNFFGTIDGFPLAYWHVVNRNDYSKLPSGIRVVNASTLHIELRKTAPAFIQALHRLDIQLQDSTYGTGDYKWTTQKKKFHWLEAIDTTKLNLSVRMVKNEDYLVEEFKKERLDIIAYDPNNTRTVDHKDYLNELIQSEYPEYKVLKQNKSLLTVALIHGSFDSLTHRYLHKTLKTNSQQRIDGLYKQSIVDSVALNEVPIIGDLSFSELKYPFKSTHDSLVTKNDSYIVINQLEAYTNGETYRSDRLNNQKYVCLSEKPRYYIVQQNIKGLTDYMDWKEVAQNARFITIKKY